MSDKPNQGFRRKIFFASLVTTGLLVGFEVLFRMVVAIAMPEQAEVIREYRDMSSPEMDPTIEVALHPYAVYTFFLRTSQKSITGALFFR